MQQQPKAPVEQRLLEWSADQRRVAVTQIAGQIRHAQPRGSERDQRHELRHAMFQTGFGVIAFLNPLGRFRLPGLMPADQVQPVAAIVRDPLRIVLGAVGRLRVLSEETDLERGGVVF